MAAPTTPMIVRSSPRDRCPFSSYSASRRSTVSTFCCVALARITTIILDSSFVLVGGGVGPGRSAPSNPLHSRSVVGGGDVGAGYPLGVPPPHPHPQRSAIRNRARPSS